MTSKHAKRIAELKKEMQKLADESRDEFYSNVKLMAAVTAQVAQEPDVYGHGWANEARTLAKQLEELVERLQRIRTTEDREEG